MEFQSEVEYQKFLVVFGSPFKSMCKIITLKNAVILIAIFDIIIGILNFIGGIANFIRFITWSYRYAYFYFELLSNLTNVINIPFAFIGIRGITKLNLEDIELYYKFELFELCFETFLGTVEAILRGDYNGNLVGELIIQVIVVLLSVIVTKVVWSAMIRLRYNETILVVHGEEALILMRQQEINLANPKVITPGMPIYFASPGQI